MHEYLTPSIAAYQNRKLFHSNERDHTETTEQWFHRVFESLEGCEYQEFADFILIDKFIAGLDFETFQKCAKNRTLNLGEVLSITQKEDPISTFESIETTPDPSDFLTEDDIKLEENDSESQIDEKDFDENNLNENDLKPNNEADRPKSELELNYQNNDELDTSNVFTENAKKIKGFKRDESRNIICLDCGKKFKHKVGYNYHKKKHTGSGLHYCTICSRGFVKEGDLRRHMPFHEHENKSLECYLCSSKFNRLHGLRIHFRHYHVGRTKCHLQCSMCNRKFSKQKDFDLHMNVHRGLVEGHKCPHCDKTFDKRFLLKEHIVVHLKTRDFVCETCGKAFKCKSTLKKHSRVHNSNRSFKCSECGRVLKSPAALTNHMRLHTGERPFSCHLCPKTFISNSNLFIHLRVHQKYRPHECTVCSKRFATRYDLRTHMNTHTGARPYKCDQCDKTFTQPGALRLHQRKLHQQ